MTCSLGLGPMWPAACAVHEVLLGNGLAHLFTPFSMLPHAAKVELKVVAESGNIYFMDPCREKLANPGVECHKPYNEQVLWFILHYDPIC